MTAAMERSLLTANGAMPNNPALPVVIRRGIVPVGHADAVEAVMRGNGWRPDWRDGVYAYHHYHSTAHEALACVAGDAELMLGGAGGWRVRIEAGDLLVLPAGTGHCRVAGSRDLLIVGAYPAGQDWDVCRVDGGGDTPDPAAVARIAAVPLPTGDPVVGGVLPDWGMEQ